MNNNISWVFVLLALFVAMGAFLYFAFYRHRARPDTSASTPQPEPDSLQELVVLNLEIRKAAVPATLASQCERLIDKLVELIPRVRDADDSSGELAWTVNRIASDYLPNKCVRPYLALTPKDRLSPDRIQTFEQSLAALSNELNELSAVLSRRDQNEFANKAKFLKHRFTSTGEA